MSLDYREDSGASELFWSSLLQSPGLDPVAHETSLRSYH